MSRTKIVTPELGGFTLTTEMDGVNWRTKEDHLIYLKDLTEGEIYYHSLMKNNNVQSNDCLYVVIDGEVSIHRECSWETVDDDLLRSSYESSPVNFPLNVPCFKPTGYKLKETKTHPLTRAMYDRFMKYMKNPSNGLFSLHIVLEDYNIDNDSIKFCINYAHERGDFEGMALGKELLRLSKTQRLKLINNGYTDQSF